MCSSLRIERWEPPSGPEVFLQRSPSLAFMKKITDVRCIIEISLFEADVMSQILLSHVFLLKGELVFLNFCYCNSIIAQFKETECTRKADI